MAVAQAYGRYDASSDSAGVRMFKKHKVLPHPKRDTPHGMSSPEGRHLPRRYDLTVDTSLSRKHGSQPSSPPVLNHRPRRIGSGPDLPPTPPAHSRNSSSTHSALPSSPTFVASPTLSLENTATRAPAAPATPPNQRSPPTPDVTPPQPANRPRALRPLISPRTVSRSATTDSRTESFKTAREDPYTSEEEERKSTVRPSAPSARTSQTTVRRLSGEKLRKPDGLGLGLESTPEKDLTPKQRGEFISFDGEWGSGSEVEQEWDYNLQRNVTVRKRRKAPETPRTPRANGHRDEVTEDTMVTPTNATKALRSMPLHDRTVTYPLPRDVSDRGIPWTAPSHSQSSIPDVRRFSGMSSRSNASTIVEAILVDGPPRRRNTLRHVTKNRSLRDSSSDFSPVSSAPNSSVDIEHSGRRPRVNGRYHHDARHESYTSNSTINSVSSGKARREVWRNGGIPVVIVPARKSSVKSKSSREPSLRSTSSRRSKRSVSLNSVPILNGNGTRGNDLTPYFDRPSRRIRTMSESEGSDQRTMDYPPIVPRRSSSLSAPTSRNVSRAGSLTADSLRAHDALLAQKPQREPQHPPEVKLQPAPSLGSEKDLQHKLSVDHHGDPFFGKRLSAQNTPFSLASVDTNGTAPEVSEAMAVSIFPHQNTSVLVVQHSRKTSEGSEETQRELRTMLEQPTIKTTCPDSDVPVTPPQPHFSMDDVDSPLRNPRAPPEPPTEPPAIKFIPATPSGLTPATERQNLMGNYFEEMSKKPQRGMSLVRQALTRRRHSIDAHAPASPKRPGFFKRTLSLSRNVGKDPNALSSRRASTAHAPYPTPDDAPAEENKLHPFWRPAYSDHGHDHSGDENEDEDWVRDVDEPVEEVYRYPPVDNRPPPPKRNFSSRMRRTFAILPIKPDDEYLDGPEGPDRRTIRRTASGSLRVMRHRASLESFRQAAPSYDSRPYTAPDSARPPKTSWRGGNGRTMSLTLGGKVRLLPALGSKLEDLQNLPRKISERRREKRTQELRGKISGPREVRDGVGEVIRRSSNRAPQTSQGSVVV